MAICVAIYFNFCYFLNMFKRFLLNFALIFLFAFAQIGAVSHEISHFEDYAKHSQHDKNTHNEQCAQCISFAKIAGGIASQGFTLPLISASFFGAIGYQLSHSSYLHTAYAARAPPLTNLI